MNETIRFSAFAAERSPWDAAAKALRACPGATFVIEPGIYEISTARARQTMERVLSGDFGENPERAMFRPDFGYDIGVRLDELNDITVEAEGVTLLMDGFMEPLSVCCSNNVTIKGLTIDHKRKPYSCGRVSGWHAVPGGASFTVTFFDRFPVRANTPMPRVCLFDENANRYTSYNDFHVLSRRWLGGQTFMMQTDADLPFCPDGMLLYVWHTFHSRPCVHIEESRNITLSSVTLHSQPGMGIVAHRCENLTFERLRVVPSAGEHMSTNTDATHITSCKGTVRYTNCFFEGQGDDAINIHTYAHTILSSDGAECLVRNEAPTGTHSQTPDLFDAGDVVELTEAASLRATESFTVLKCNLLSHGEMRVLLDRPLPAGCVMDFLVNVTRQPELFFVGNVCRNHMGRSVLVKVKRAHIMDNTLIDVVGTAIYIAAESPWKEALCATEDIQVRGNRIVYCGRNDDIRQRQCAGICVTVDAPRPWQKTHKHIVITDNIVQCPDSPIGIYVSNTETLTLERNHVVARDTPVCVVDCAPGDEEEEMILMRKRTAPWLALAGNEKSARDQSLLARAVHTLEMNLFSGKKFPWDPYRCVSPCSGHFDGIWNWDSAFHAMGIAHWDAALARESLLGFFRFQREDGMLPDVIWANGDSFYGCSKPPVMAQAVEAVYRRAPDRAFLEAVYPVLERNARFWEQRRQHGGLFHYASETNDEDANQNARFESGWDNSVRWDKGIERLWPIDLNCFMVMFYRSIAFLGGELGRDTHSWTAKSETLSKNVNDHLWNENAACYADADMETGAFSPVLSPASFMPLYAGIAPEARARAMAVIAADKAGFYPGMPTVSYGDPEYSDTYWRGPTWLNVAYFAIKGLHNYGFPVADEIRQTLLSWCDADKRGIFENYRSQTGAGQCCDHFSWSAAFIIAMICDFD